MSNVALRLSKSATAANPTPIKTLASVQVLRQRTGRCLLEFLMFCDAEGAVSRSRATALELVCNMSLLLCLKLERIMNRHTTVTPLSLSPPALWTEKQACKTCACPDCCFPRPLPTQETWTIVKLEYYCHRHDYQINSLGIFPSNAPVKITKLMIGEFSSGGSLQGFVHGISVQVSSDR